MSSNVRTLAMEKGEATKNPCSKVSLYPEQNREPYLTSEEETKLMLLLEHRPHLCDMDILAVNTGMRQGEILKLKPERIDFVRNLIAVTETKSGKNRKVPMNEEAREFLLRLVKETRAKSWKYIFTNPKTLTRYKSIKTVWTTACRLAEIENLRFHDLRHTFGTRAADEGVPLTAIAKVRGHALTQTTERYAHATDEGIRRAVEALQKKQRLVTNWSQEERKEGTA